MKFQKQYSSYDFLIPENIVFFFFIFALSFKIGLLIRARGIYDFQTVITRLISILFETIGWKYR